MPDEVQLARYGAKGWRDTRREGGRRAAYAVLVLLQTQAESRGRRRP